MISYIPWLDIGNKKLDISTCTDISNSIQDVFNPSQRIMYYATPDKIYAVNVLQASGNVATPVFDLAAQVSASGDKITNMQLYQQAWYNLQSDNPAMTPIETNNKQLVITTYNEQSGEGKIWLLPITNLETGALGTAKTIPGFGEITCISTLPK